jgi:hypothetical protein
MWIAGLGFGNCTPIGKGFDFRPEVIHYSYYPANFKNVKFTSSTHLKFGFVYHLNDKLGLSLAPSVYTLSTSRKSGAEYYRISPIGALYTRDKNNNLTTIGVGISLGLCLR